jgi:hypothetical protein
MGMLHRSSWNWIRTSYVPESTSIGMTVQIKVDTDPTQFTNTHLIEYLLEDQAAL